MSTTVTGRQYNIGKVCATINGRPAVALAASAPLSTSWNENTCTINIAPATTTTPGYLSAADKIKLDNLAVAIGETSVTAYRGDRGKVAYDHSQIVSGNPHGITKETLNLGNVTNYDQSKAINSITRSGTTFTYTCLDGTDGTFTQQDTTYSAATAAPLVDGTASVGVSEKYAREDHVHPTDTSRASTAVAVANGANGLMSGTDKAKLDSISVPTSGVSMPVIMANQNVATFNSDVAGRPLHATVNIQPMQASGTPSPSNPLPITGWTGMNIFIGNKNCAWLTTNSRMTVTRSTNSITNTVTDTRTLQLVAWYYNQSVVIGTEVLPPTGGKVISIPSGTTQMNFGHSGAAVNIITEIPVHLSGPHYLSYTTSGTDPSVLGGLTINNIQLEIGSIATDFVAPTEPITVSFPSSAGTVYGGTLDVARGLLTVDKAYLILNASGIGQINELQNTFFYALTGLMVSHNEYGLSNKYIHKETGEMHYPSDGEMVFGSSYIGTANRLYFRDDRFSSLSDMQADAEQNPITVVYPLATPVTYQLTPQQLVTLAGTNNVFADCGNVDVTYWPGTGVPMTPVNDENNITLVKNILTRMDNLETAIVQMGGTI